MKDVIEQVLRKLKIYYETNTLLRNFVALGSNTRLYEMICNSRIKKQSLKDINSPLNIIIETTNICNADCIMCPYGKMRRKKGIMSDDIFAEIIDKLKSEGVQIYQISLSGFGEPFIDPKIVDRIKMLQSANANWKVKIHTNASLIKEEKMEELLLSGIDEINISFNGTSKGNYEAVMRNLRYDDTFKNIMKLLEIKDALKLKKPIIRLSSVLLEYNDNSVNEHLAFWKRKVDSGTVLRPHPWGGDIDLRSKYKIESRKIWPCRFLWYTANISWNGDVLLCCIDYDGKVILGNILNQTFMKIWLGEKMQNVRRLHLEKNIHEIPLCKNCSVPKENAMQWWISRYIS